MSPILTAKHTLPGLTTNLVDLLSVSIPYMAKFNHTQPSSSRISVVNTITQNKEIPPIRLWQNNNKHIIWFLWTHLIFLAFFQKFKSLLLICLQVGRAKNQLHLFVYAPRALMLIFLVLPILSGIYIHISFLISHCSMFMRQGQQGISL